MARHSGVSALALGVALWIGLPLAAHAAGETIALLTKNQTNPFFTAERIGAEKAAHDMDAKIIEYIPTQPDSISEQMSEIDNLIQRKPDAIVMVPVDYKAMVPGVERINAAGIPVVNITDRSAGGKFVAFVGANDYEIAKATGAELLKAMGGKGTVMILEGVPGALTSMDRLRGFKEAIKDFPGVKLVASQPANYQRLQAMQVMDNLLQSHPNVDGIMASNDAMAIGAVDALEDANHKALVVGINGTLEAIDAIKSGKMLATGDYDGFLQGCIGTMIAIRALRHEPVPQTVTAKPVVIDRANYAAYDMTPAQRSCPAWSQAMQP
jgi:ribose transport system substrate-binding protein